MSAIKKDGQTFAIQLDDNRTTRAQTMVEAHEALIKAVPENLPKFKGCHSVPQGRVAFVEITLQPDLISILNVNSYLICRTEIKVTNPRKNLRPILTAHEPASCKSRGI